MNSRLWIGLLLNVIVETAIVGLNDKIIVTIILLKFLIAINNHDYSDSLELS